MLRFASVVLGSAALVAIGCGGGGGNNTGRCYTDQDCPTGQFCAGGNCVLPGDPGLRFCATDGECFIGERCLDGVCAVVQEEPRDEPDAGDDGDEGPGDDGGQVEDGDEPTGDEGGGPDEDTRDYSRFNFTLALRDPGGAPASQCLRDLRPAASAGPVVPDATAAAGFRLSGQVRSGGSPLSGARVRVLGETPECLPAPVTTDGSGFAFQLPPGGPYDLQAVAADGRVGYARLNSLQGNATQNIDLPATSPLNGGPIYETGVPHVNGWTVQAFYRTGVNAGRLAHAGVLAGPPTGDGLFSLPLEVGPSYDLVGQPPAGSAYPFQILYEDYCHAGQPCSNYNLGSVRLRDGFTLGGRVSTSTGQGATGSPIALVRETDVRLGLELAAGADGNYSALLRPGGWIITVLPAVEAFALGALSYLIPRQSIVNADVTKNVPLGAGEVATFRGRLLTAQGAGQGGVQVRLLVMEQPMQEGSYSVCDSAWVTTEADGGYQIRCNLAPP